MPISKTKALAKKLGLLKQKRKAEYEADSDQRRKRRKGQMLSYVIVIDFESTCWKDKKGAQEIIEFPAVLLDLQTGEIVGEFQQYVQPQECPILSDFCKQLTGITQDQVDGGVPLPTCLYLFAKWVRALKEERGVCLMEPGQQYSSKDDNLCALATWSDWDLGVCLQYECRRKQIRKPPCFSQWIDLRVVYKQFYDRKPSGLCGSLEDLGIQFIGREHCGLDDARNTAKLCYRLVTDGCRLNITRCLLKKETAGPVIKAPGTSSKSEKEKENCSADLKNQSLEKYTSVSQHQSRSVKDTPPFAVREKVSQAPMEQHTAHTKGLVEQCTTHTKGLVEQCTTHRDKDSVSLSDESFLNSITAHELEELERDLFEAATTKQKDNVERCGLSQSLSIKSVTRSEGTPSRTNFLSHITPVTLLPATGLNQRCNKANTLPSCNQQLVCTSPSGTTTSTPPTPSLLRVQQKPVICPTASTCTIDTSLPCRAQGAANSAVSNTLGFQTPSTVQWMKAKSFQSSVSSSGSPQPFNGGKLTPPLCKCGKRAKRKLVTSPGPNQGRPFFSCPAGRSSGCQYFRWETPSLSISDTVDLNSEYS